jgi:hypothetical protein
MSRAIDTLRRGMKQEGAIIRNLATSPQGPFGTIDKMVKTARTTVRNTARAAGVPSLRGQLKGQKKLGYRIFGKSPLLRKQLSPARVGKNVNIIKRMATKGLLPQGLPPRGTGLLTGRARSTRGGGRPLTEVQRAIRHRAR